jgi:hypothetical protein
MLTNSSHRRCDDGNTLTKSKVYGFLGKRLRWYLSGAGAAFGNLIAVTT